MLISDNISWYSWMKKADADPGLKWTLKQAQGWANVMEDFVQRGMGMEIDDLESIDPTGVGYEFLKDCWGLREGLRRQKEKDEKVRKEASEALKQKMHKST